MGLVGLISYKIEGDTLDIHRVAVHPSQFKKGIAKQMINFIEGINSPINKIIVSTASKNQPAINLYLKLGFQRVWEREIEKGLYITSFEKNTIEK